MPQGINFRNPDGNFSTGVGGACPLGMYCPEGTGHPLPCPRGTYSHRLVPGHPAINAALSYRGGSIPPPPRLGSSWLMLGTHTLDDFSYLEHM